MPKLCLTLAERSLSSLNEKIALYSGRVPWIEVRLDYLRPPRFPQLPADTSTSFIATCRPRREGGEYDGEESARLSLLQEAASAGFSWIDLEHDVAGVPSGKSEVRVIRSLHLFEEFPADLQERFDALRRAGGDLFKLAVTVKDTEELTRLLGWMESLPAEPAHVILAMGSFGQAARFLNGFLGSAWTYVCEPGRAVASGQFSLEEAQTLYRLDRWETAAKIYGVLGNPVAHSRSPWVHNQLFKHYRQEGLYLPFHLDRLEPWFRYLDRSRLDFRGFSVTLPFKTEVTRFVHTADSPVKSINTLCREGTGWRGFNSDLAGFLKPLLARVSLAGKEVLVLGNGGVAHTVVAALQQEGARVRVVGRDAGRVSRFAAAYGCPHHLFSELPIPADICVNTTPVGQAPDLEASPLREDQLCFGLVYDLVYSPEETRLVQMARRQGISVITGMEMFIEQGALQFESWTGIDPDRQLMRELLQNPHPRSWPESPGAEAAPSGAAEGEELR